MIRKAILSDVNDIHALLQLYHKQGKLLARPLSKLYDHLRDFWVFEDDTKKTCPSRSGPTASDASVFPIVMKSQCSKNYS